MNEREAIARLRTIATSHAARGLLHDSALFDGLVITHACNTAAVPYHAADPPPSGGC